MDKVEDGVPRVRGPRSNRIRHRSPPPPRRLCTALHGTGTERCAVIIKSVATGL